ncbi:MAG: hypothetical protein HOD03_07500, partial [Planctomycetes bacterium]|nr:hypothetical protein [Planctomycetota bacterium]
MKLSRNNRISTAGFTLMEIMVATSIAMVLLFGALYSTSETLEVVREGDIRMHTNVNARRALNRLIKDCRYASEIEVAGTQQTGWTIGIGLTRELPMLGAGRSSGSRPCHRRRKGAVTGTMIFLNP